MIRFCGRCGQIFTFLDLKLVHPGLVVRHYVFCPPRVVKA